MVSINELLDEKKEETKWEKFKDNLEYYLLTIPKSWYNEIELGIKSLIRRIPYIWKLRDWDYGYVIEAEMNELIILRDGIKKYQNHLNWKRDVETLNVAIKLASEISKGGWDDKKTLGTNLRNMKRYLKYTDHIERILNTPDTPKDIRLGLTNEMTAKNIVREEKVWVLYHKYRAHYMRSWWD